MRRLCIGLALVLSLCAQAASAERCRAVGVTVDERLEGHELSLTMVHDDREFAAGRGAGAAVPVGVSVDVCFTSSKSGFVSLWSHAANNDPPVRILPNAYIDADHDDYGISVRAGETKCFSELGSSRKLSLRVQEPFGEAELYLHFAEDREGQFSPSDFPSIGNKSYDLGDSCPQPTARAVGTKTDPYSSRVLRYEVVQ